MEDMLAAFKEFHFADAYERPKLMGEYGEEERNRKLIDLLRAVLTASPIAVKYLRAAAASPPDDLRRVLQSFVTLFARLEQDYSANHVGKGFFLMPVHQLFSAFISRVLMRHYFDSQTSSTFNKYLTENLVGDMEL